MPEQAGRGGTGVKLEAIAFNRLSNPLIDDSDGDGLLDGFEVDNGFDPATAGDETEDPDGDGLDNLGEQTAGTDPNDEDFDNDGLLDGFEVDNGFDPTGPDESAGDPDGDGLDNLAEQANGTDPNVDDTDGIPVPPF